jgi:YegS/Rv2252/BmrU family lipid kinase
VVPFFFNTRDNFVKSAALNQIHSDYFAKRQCDGFDRLKFYAGKLIVKVHVIINPAAGSEEPVLFQMNSFFKKHDVDYQVSVTTPRYSADELTRRALDEHIDAIVGYGGDGTMMSIANVLQGTDTPLLIVPGGTANVLSQELHIPPSIPKALSLLLPEFGQPSKIDIGLYNDAIFLANLGVGIPAHWVQEATRELKNKYGLMAYIIGGVKAALKAKSAEYTLTLDGKIVETEGLMCMVANIGSTGFRGLRLMKDISVTDGYLDVIIIKLKLYENFLDTSEESWYKFKENRNLFFEHHRAQEIKIEADPVQPVNVDGEMADDTPVVVKVSPSALTVFRPTEKGLTLWDRIVKSISK